jgi:CTP:molybdopterin cytidylyltransferase MocA
VQARVAGVLLAAGAGSRLGRPKALVELGGQTLAERGVQLLRAGGADPVLIVTGAAPVTLAGVRTVHNEQWRTGMGSSLRAALIALDQAEPADAGGPAAVVVALADQPLVGHEAVARLIRAYRDGARVAVAGVPAGPGGPGHAGGMRRHRPRGRHRHGRGPGPGGATGRPYRRPRAGTAGELRLIAPGHDAPGVGDGLAGF